MDAHVHRCPIPPQMVANRTVAYIYIKSLVFSYIWIRQSHRHSLMLASRIKVWIYLQQIYWIRMYRLGLMEMNLVKHFNMHNIDPDTVAVNIKWQLFFQFDAHTLAKASY